jgi:hypothetical protein
MVMEHPLIYVNGCSYSDENYHATMQDNTYAHHYGRLINGFVLSRARSGSCNRRIVRTTVHDMIQQRQLNPTQRIIALIQLTFEIREELWFDDIQQTLDPCETNFRSHQFSEMLSWREQLLTNKKISNHTGFLRKWSEGRAFFYNSYAQRINLLLDVLLLQNLLRSLDIQYLIFQGPRAERLEDEYLKDFFLKQLSDPCILDFETFGFCNWCAEQGFTPLDSTEPAGIGHYKPDAHLAFAEKFLYNIL